MTTINYNTPLTKYERIFDYLAFALILLLFFYTAKNVSAMPERIPTHFGVSGQPDAWGSLWTIWLLPATAVFLYFLLKLADKFPKFINYPFKITDDNAQRQFLLARFFLKTIKLAIILVLLVIQVNVVKVALGQAVEFAPYVVPVLLALVFVPVALYMYLAWRAR